MYLFSEAIPVATNKSVADMQDIRYLSDWLIFLDSFLLWVPSKSIDATGILNRCSRLYFVLGEPLSFRYQSPVIPNFPGRLSFVSKWLIRFIHTFGFLMNTLALLMPELLATFEASPEFCLSENVIPRGSWRNFNEFFARDFKPGYRPQAAVDDSSTIVSPADITFNGQLEISPLATYIAKCVTWSISELMANSPFKDRFHRGTWMHGCFAESDYQPYLRSRCWQNGGSRGYVRTTLCTDKHNGPGRRSERLRG